jgi:hypothetical protein
MATNTHSKYITLIALPLQQWLREHAPILHFTYIACLVIHIRGHAIKIRDVLLLKVMRY